MMMIGLRTFIEECANLINDKVACVFTEVQLFDESKNEFGRKIFQLEKESGIFSIRKLKHFNQTLNFAWRRGFLENKFYLIVYSLGIFHLQNIIIMEWVQIFCFH